MPDDLSTLAPLPTSVHLSFCLMQAVKPQFEAARQWAKAQADAKLKGEEAAPLRVVTSQSGILV